MDAILTHDNADFDALAALLGAKKIYAEALAILPPRLNRNVRDFCTLYCDSLPFTRPEDLPRQKFQSVVIVDTQAIQSTRGVTTQTQLHFIDHHPLARNLESGMTFFGGETGATTTLFVEQISDKELPLTPVEATLLLLGIYEDTGSLSYITTTARDARAAAFLMEHGASLAVANDFLHHPLTEEQNKLYLRLIDNIKTINIAGHAIAIATARADKYTEEVSTLAHQLRELYDPAAIFVLVHMDDHIQLVARSEQVEINVATIAEAFGGGGHDKASAAMIRGLTLRQAKSKLLKLLKTNVKPSITVRQLMSFGVHTLEANVTVAQAAEAVNRYGHEGFPIARKGKLVGVLTRREIDRAMHHKLGTTPVKNLMHKPVSVSPHDSVEKLRAVMIESDLGQVPVIDKNKIIGIVTRTDLIKPWDTARPPRAEDMAQRLEKWLPPDLLALVHYASQTAQELGYGLYVVGGFVRDLLLNQPNLDLDLVVEGEAIELAKTLEKKFGGHVHAHSRFGTAKWILDKPEQLQVNHLDFTTARTEFYAHPSALPEVETSSLKQDLRRRDFTINTLAIGLDPERYGQLIDPFGGEEDLRRGLIRALHNLSFIDDPTRILRAVRFEQRFGFKIEPRTAQLIGDALDMIARVTGERLRHELELIFDEGEPEKALTRLQELGVLRAILPPFEFTEWHARKFRAARDVVSKLEVLGYFGLLAYHFSPSTAAEFAKRLKLSNPDAETIMQVIALREEVAAPLADESLAPSAVYRLLEGYSDAALNIFAIATDDIRLAERIDVYRTRLSQIETELTGDDLKKMGIRPGPAFKDILSRLRDKRLDGILTNRDQEIQFVRHEIDKLQAVIDQQ
ncbi:MAG: CBS domain-containing protein [Chloroflexi bacterium]|nr:CBS domain-containing protein [Chloroflexota bacterium]